MKFQHLFQTNVIFFFLNLWKIFFFLWISCCQCSIVSVLSIQRNIHSNCKGILLDIKEDLHVSTNCYDCSILFAGVTWTSWSENLLIPTGKDMYTVINKVTKVNGRGMFGRWHVVFVLSVILSSSENLILLITFEVLIFHMSIPCDKTFLDTVTLTLEFDPFFENFYLVNNFWTVSAKNKSMKWTIVFLLLLSDI